MRVHSVRRQGHEKHRARRQRHRELFCVRATACILVALACAAFEREGEGGESTGGGSIGASQVNKVKGVQRRGGEAGEGEGVEGAERLEGWGEGGERRGGD